MCTVRAGCVQCMCDVHIVYTAGIRGSGSVRCVQCVYGVYSACMVCTVRAVRVKCVTLGLQLRLCVGGIYIIEYARCDPASLHRRRPDDVVT